MATMLDFTLFSERNCFQKLFSLSIWLEIIDLLSQNILLLLQISYLPHWALCRPLWFCHQSVLQNDTQNLYCNWLIVEGVPKPSQKLTEPAESSEPRIFPWQCVLWLKQGVCSQKICHCWSKNISLQNLSLHKENTGVPKLSQGCSNSSFPCEISQMLGMKETNIFWGNSSISWQNLFISSHRKNWDTKWMSKPAK